MLNRLSCLHRESRSIIIRVGITVKVLSYALEVLLVILNIKLWKPRNINITKFAHAEARRAILKQLGSSLLIQKSIFFCEFLLSFMQKSIVPLTLAVSMHLSEFELILFKLFKYTFVFFGYSFRNVDHSDYSLLVVGRFDSFFLLFRVVRVVKRYFLVEFMPIFIISWCILEGWRVHDSSEIASALELASYWLPFHLRGHIRISFRFH